MLRDLKRKQRRWAQAQGFAIDQNGYVHDRNQNFLYPLSAEFQDALAVAGGGELEAQRGRPAKIEALHSSAALVINVFGHWLGHSGPELPAALGIDGALEAIEIERPFPSGLEGTAPTLDVVLTRLPGAPIAIESKYTEWMTKKRPKLAHFEAKYLKPEASLWAAKGLPHCQQLAADIAAGREAFRQLDALQLLKHALGLANTLREGFSLLYIYYDVEGRSDMAALHRTEIERFTSFVDPSIGFRGLSYQQLFAGMANTPGVDANYLDYLRNRYFPGA